MEAAVFIGLLAAMLRLATPLLLGSLSGIWAERSGVVNIAIEGMMLTGAFAGYVTAERLLDAEIFDGIGTGHLWLGVLAAVVAGAVLGLVHAFWTQRFRTDQIVSGTALNILALGVTAYALRLIYDVGGSTKLPETLPALFSWTVEGKDGPVGIAFTPLMVVSVLLCLVTHVVLFRTPWGMRTQASGEHPLTLSSLGLSVLKTRYANMAISGGLAGLAGAFLTLEGIGQFNEGMTSGKGFIALAVMIFGRWRPLPALAAACLFGLADALQIFLQTLGVQVPAEWLQMLPYLLTLVALMGLMGRARPPAALGQVQ
ncbi:MAG: ABC transporter permease [Candidatus Sericytochromatia bacterium]|nr:ABC transporter permease [Candidatus Sericytochromatia bacterium]